MAGPKAILVTRVLLRKSVLNVKQEEINEIADRKFTKVTKVFGRKNMAKSPSNFTSPAPTLAMSKSGETRMQSSRLTR